MSFPTLGQPVLPGRLPFSKPKVNWLLHVKKCPKIPKMWNLSKDLNPKNIFFQIEKSEYIHKLLDINNIQSKLLKLTHQ